MKCIERYENGNYEVNEEIDGVKQGKATFYYKNCEDKIKEEFYYVDNVRTGESLLLFQEGIEKRCYKNDRLEGLSVKYFLDGRIEESRYGNQKEKIAFAFDELRDILGMESKERDYTINGLEEDKKNGYKVFIKEAQTILTEYANLNKKLEK